LRSFLFFTTLLGQVVECVRSDTLDKNHHSKERHSLLKEYTER
jgi:hypothetical protein